MTDMIITIITVEQTLSLCIFGSAVLCFWNENKISTIDGK